MSLRLNAIVLLACAALLPACNRQGENTAPAAQNPSSGTAAAPTEAAAPAPAKSQNGMVVATPGTIASCEVAGTVHLKWDVRTPGIEGTQMFIGEGPEAKLFAAGGAQGEADTGPWVAPGAVFVLRNAKDSAELDRVIVGGPTCTPAASSNQAPASAPVENIPSEPATR